MKPTLYPSRTSPGSWIARFLFVTTVLFLTACVPGGGDKDDHHEGGNSSNVTCTSDNDVIKHSKWSCTNGIGQTFYSNSPTYCAQYYPNCASAADLPYACVNPQLKLGRTCVTHTATSTSTSTSTNVDVFPDVPGRTCTVDRFQQASGTGPALKKVDILFMMDHSGSMQDDWERVANNMQELVKQLPSDTDIRYAVVLGDVGTWKGRLYAPVGYPYVLNNQTMTIQQISNNLHKMFVEGMKVSDSGSGEALFYSLYHAVTSKAAANQKLGFFRPDAALSVIFMSDEQEIGYPFPSHAALAADGLPYRCDETFEDGVKQKYYDQQGVNLDVAWNAVKALKGDLPVRTHAFVNLNKEDLFKRNSKNAKCLYDSLGYGYPEMVAKSGGVLFSIQANKVDGLAACGRAINESLKLQHDFQLSKPADKVDAATILAAVDNALTDHTYSAAANSVHLDNAGRAGSAIAIRHCEPDGRVDWNLTDFDGVPAQYSVGLSWKTVEYATSGKVLFGLADNALTHEVAEAGAATAHSVTVTGLDPNTVYYFQAVSSDEFGIEKKSPVRSFRTLPDWTISSVSAQAARTSASVQWTTSEYATKGHVVFGTSAAALTRSTADTVVANAHSVALTGLSAGTTYFYQVVGSDEFGLVKTSPVLSFTTENDWGIFGFAGAATRSAVTLEWTTDENTTGAILWGTSAGLGHQTNEGAAAGTAHRVVVTGLNADQDYYFKVLATDANGQQKTSNIILVHTSADWDISGFAGSSTQTTVTLGWATPGYATTGRVYWGATDNSLTNAVDDAAFSASHGVTVSGLNADTIYYFQASSVDSDGIEKRSAVVAIRTQQVPLPTWEISGFAGTSTQNVVTLSWTTAQYATQGKVLWGTDPNGLNNEVNEAAPGTSHGISVGSLAADTIYYFQVVATDDRGQLKSSDVIAVRTMVDPNTNPPSNWVVTGFDGTTTSSEASLIWQTPGAQTKATIKVGLTATDLTLKSVEVPDFTDTHLQTISGLNSGTAYFFQVVATDNTGRSVESVVIKKTTK